MQSKAKAAVATAVRERAMVEESLQHVGEMVTRGMLGNRRGSADDKGRNCRDVKAQKQIENSDGAEEVHIVEADPFVETGDQSVELGHARDETEGAQQVVQLSNPLGQRSKRCARGRS